MKQAEQSSVLLFASASIGCRRDLTSPSFLPDPASLHDLKSKILLFEIFVYSGRPAGSLRIAIEIGIYGVYLSAWSASAAQNSICRILVVATCRNLDPF